jgi:hypothetical protein
MARIEGFRPSVTGAASVMAAALERSLTAGNRDRCPDPPAGVLPDPDSPYAFC